MNFHTFKKMIFDISIGICIGGAVGLMFLIMVLFGR